MKPRPLDYRPSPQAKPRGTLRNDARHLLVIVLIIVAFTVALPLIAFFLRWIHVH